MLLSLIVETQGVPIVFVLIRDFTRMASHRYHQDLKSLLFFGFFL